MSYNDIDLLFLDIEMPIVNGFDFLDGLKTVPQVIFVTSKAEYAVKAFDYDATDYLQKPITSSRFEIAIKRALSLLSLKKEKPDLINDFIFVKSKLKKLKIHASTIKWIEALGDYMKVVTDAEVHVVLSTMKSMEADLVGKNFLRVHKSYIINVDRINRFNNKFAEIGNDKVPLSRNKKEQLKKAFESESE
jgi:DNA-binding LytR/AlgR family response regulator